MDHSFDVSYTQNRELSWLKFNERVLKEAQDITVPLLERLKFLAIFQSNLDEFFMIRVGSLTDLSSLKKITLDNKSNLSIKEQLQLIYKEVESLVNMKDNVFNKLTKQLTQHGIEHCTMQQLSSMEIKTIEELFKKEISPLLSPSIIDSHHPFPHIQNKRKVVVASLVSNDGFETVGLIPVSDNLPQFIRLQRETIAYVLMEDIISYYFSKVFKQYDVSKIAVIAVTRNADINLEDEYYDYDVDFRVHMKQILKKRGKLSPVRLEVQNELSNFSNKLLKSKLKLSDSQIHFSQAPLDFSYVYELIDQCSLKDKAELLYTPYNAPYPSLLSKKESIIDQLLNQDVVLSFPYEDVDVLLQLLKESASSTHVTSIKISIYRLAQNSKIIQYLSDAAENGKEVTVLIELRARFDERNNIDYAEILEQAGCQLIYGFEDYKVHAKCLSITMIKNDKLSYISGIGTGNFNEKTAQQYADLLLLTSHNGIGEDVNNFFKNMAISNLSAAYRYLSVSPFSFRLSIINGIDQEISKAKKNLPAYLLFKCNSLTDRQIIDKLQEASEAGVHIDLIIRGICCIVPQIKNKTENIHVYSVVGRYLEHARVYCFGHKPSMKTLISSGDLMTRSTTQRVEVATEVLDPIIKSKIYKTLSLALKDNAKKRELNSYGNYQKTKKKKEVSFDSQKQLMSLALQNSKKEPQVLKQTKKPLVGWIKNWIKEIKK